MTNEKATNSTPTIKDVARMAGVSTSTVSRVINNQGGVSRDLTERITRAIDTLKFKPNQVARALKARTTHSIGLIIPTVENPVFTPLVKVVETTADRYGFATILCNSDGLIEKEARYLELLVEMQVDGIIFNAIGQYDQRFEIVKNCHTPIIVMGRKIKGFETANVNANNFRGAYLAVEYLIKTGMRDIAFLFGQLESFSAIGDRFAGYQAALRDCGIAFRDDMVVECKRSFEGGVSAADELLSRGIRFDSVFASNDMVAIGCIEKLTEKGYSIPGDISVVGYDDIPSGRVIKPRLSTVVNPPDKLGVGAVKNLLRIIYTQKDDLQEKMFEPHLVLRNSTRPPAKPEAPCEPSEQN